VARSAWRSDITLFRVLRRPSQDWLHIVRELYRNRVVCCRLRSEGSGHRQVVSATLITDIGKANLSGGRVG